MKKAVAQNTKAELVIQFIERLTCPDGADVGKPFVLREWQKDWIRKVYAEEGGRRIKRQAVLSMARKNGKTALIAALCLAHLCGPVLVRNGQLYSVSYERDQAGIVFKYIAAMVRAEPVLANRLKILESQKKVVDLDKGSVYQALSSESKSKHGKSASFVVFDELAQFGSDRDLYDVMVTSAGAHDEPIFFVISTQAEDPAAILSELIDYGLENPDDPTFCVDLYEVPQDADAWNEKNWHLANPALGDFRKIEEMRDTAQKAQKMPSAESAFRNLYLNQRVNAYSAWISRTVWEACSGEPVTGPLRFGGLDLSAKNDLTALAWIEEDEEGLLGAGLSAWTPADTLAEKSRNDKVPFDVWARQGILDTCPGKVIDYAFVAHRIAELHAERPFAAIMFDRWRIDDLKRELAEIECDVELLPHGQGFKDMGKAIETLEDIVVSEKIRHGGNPLFNMACAGATTVKDPAGNRKFEKGKSRTRIDPIVALAMAASCWREKRSEEPAVSVYEERGIRTL